MKKQFLFFIFTCNMLSATEEHPKFTQEELAGINELASVIIKRPSLGRRLIRRYLQCFCMRLDTTDQFDPFVVYPVEIPGGTSVMVQSFNLEGESEE